MESAKAERCARCGATDMTNLVYVRTGDSVRVYVRCNKCGDYVARYVLSRYTSDLSYESLLKTLHQFAYASGKRCLEEVEEFGATIRAEFEKVQKLAATHPEERRVEELIEDARTKDDRTQT